jgi:hypothetical protein
VSAMWPDSDASANSRLMFLGSATPDSCSPHRRDDTLLASARARALGELWRGAQLELRSHLDDHAIVKLPASVGQAQQLADALRHICTGSAKEAAKDTASRAVF